MLRVAGFLAMALAFAGCGSTGTNPPADPGPTDAADVEAAADPAVEAGDAAEPPGEGVVDVAVEAETADVPGEPSPDPAEAVPDVPAEVADLGPDLPPYAEPPVRVEYDFAADPLSIPFPNDYYRDPVDGHVIVDQGLHANAMLPAVQAIPEYVNAFAEAHGFSTYAPLAMRLSVPPDLATLPATLADSTADGAAMQLWELDASGKPASRIEYRMVFRHWDDSHDYVLQAVTVRALKEDTRHLLVVTDALKATDGTPFARARGFAQVMGQTDTNDLPADRAALVRAEHDRIAPVVAQLSSPDHVVSAVIFTTGHEADETIRIFRQFRAGSNLAIQYTVNPDTDVKAGPDFANCPTDAAVVAYGVAGTFAPINYTDPKGHFEPDGDTWKTFDQAPIPFYLMVPAGTGPFPIAVLGHGINSNQGSLCGVGQELARRGLATLRFDWPHHGTRGSGGVEFLSVNDPRETRDNFRQSAMDLASSVVMVQTLAGRLDRLPWGAADGKPDLDATRVAYFGHSLGAIIGLLFFPLNDRVRVMVDNEGGVGLSHLADVFLEKNLGDVYGIIGISMAAPQLLWAADGVSFADRIFADPDGPAGGRRMLGQEVLDDGTVPNVSTEALLRGSGMKLVDPVLRPIEGVASAAPADLTSGLSQYGGTTHGTVIGGSDPASLAMRQQFEDYLASWAATGTPGGEPVIQAPVIAR